MSSEGPDLWQRVTSQDALREAWYRVHANDGSAGGDGVTLDAFGADLFANLTQLRADLLGGTYRSGPFRKVSVPKKKPGYRILTIPSVRDRVLHTSIANVLTPIFEPLFEDGSFAYRPNRGVVHAVERIEQWRKRGFTVVIEADVVSYFDNIDQDILHEKISAILSPLPGAASLLTLLRSIFEDEARALGTPARGLTQGSPLSPLLANLYLDALDEEIEAQGVKIVRFADDFVILCKSEKKAEKVLAHCVEVIARHGLRLHDEGTRIVNFDKGFDFIGYLFLRTLALKEKGADQPQARGKPIKSEVTDEGIIELEENGSRFDPGKRVLYVLDPDHTLATRNRSFSVLREDGSELIAIPHHRIGRIEIGPGAAFSRAPLDLALESGIEVGLLDGFGQTKGIVGSGGGKRAALQLAHAKAVLDEKFRATIAGHLVCARIRNQRTQLMRLNRGREAADAGVALDALKRFLRKAEAGTSVEEFRGIEGAATAVYWPALGLQLEGNDKPLRRSRPAVDPINATINYLAAVLERDTRAAIQSVGLHPGFGFLHASKDRHDGLIYDLMEPFRAPLTEGLAVHLFNARRLRPEMFSKGEDHPVEMNEDARRAVILGYEAAVAKRINRTDGGGKLAWRPMMRHQAGGLARALESGRLEDFVPYLMEA